MPDQNSVFVPVPDGWLQLTRDEYAEHLIPYIAEAPRLYTARQMAELTGIPARRWNEMAKRSEIPYLDFGDRSYRFDFHKVCSRLEEKPSAPERISMRNLMKTMR